MIFLLSSFKFTAVRFSYYPIIANSLIIKNEIIGPSPVALYVSELLHAHLEDILLKLV